jgi:hypothetical protein
MTCARYANVLCDQTPYEGSLAPLGMTKEST